MLDSRAALLALVDQAARDPSAARSLLERATHLVDAELMRGATRAPDGYMYAGAHTLVALFDDLEVEPLPDPDHPDRNPLTSTTNRPRQLEVPFNCVILGVSGWAAPVLPTTLDAEQLLGLLEMGGADDGRDLFSVMWSTDGRTDYTTDGREDRLEPAACMLGPRRNPRPLGWQPGRGTLINVKARNLTNVVNPSGFVAEVDPGWNLNVGVAFHLVNLETP